MTPWKCPNCRGEFPEPALEDGQSRCPWCSHAINGTYEYEPIKRVTKVESDDPDNGRVNLGDLFG